MERAEHNGGAVLVKALNLTALIAWALVLSGSGEERDAVERCWAEMRASAAPPPCLTEAAAGLAPEVLPSLDGGERERLARALADAVLARADRTAAVVLESSNDGEHRYRVRTSGGEQGELVLVRDGTAWIDARWDGVSMVESYRELAERLVSRYSFEYLLGELSGKGAVVLADFEGDSAGLPPRGWKRRTFGHDDGRTPYWVAEESGNRFLRAEATDENVMLYKEVRWNARKYPYLAWRWRVRNVPEGSDERMEEKADSAAGLYLSYRRKLGLVPETVKFVWSARYEAGTKFRRPGIGMPWTVVACSGEADSRWHRVVYRTEDVYRETFQGDPGERPLGIGLLTDANSTGSFAAADYDDIVALERIDGTPLLW